MNWSKTTGAYSVKCGLNPRGKIATQVAARGCCYYSYLKLASLEARKIYVFESLTTPFSQ